MPLRQPTSGFDPIQLNGQLRYAADMPLFDDFYYGTTGSQAFIQAWTIQGAGSIDFNSANVANRPGVITLNSGVANSFALLTAIEPPGPLVNGFWQFQTAVMFPVLSTGVDRYFGRLGVMAGAVASDPTDGIYFEYSDATSAGNWTAVTVNGGVSSQLDLGIPVIAGTFYNLKIQGADAAAPVSFSINGVLVGALSTNIPAAVLNIGAQMEKNAHTVVSQMRIDLIYLGYAFSSFR